MGSAEGLGVDLHSPQAALLLAGAVVFIFACGGNARHRREFGRGVQAGGGEGLRGDGLVGRRWQGLRVRGGCLWKVAFAATFAVAVEGAELKLGELGSEGG